MVDVLGPGQAIGKLKSGMTVMIGGFFGVGEPLALIESLCESGVSDLTLISVVGGYPGGGFGLGRLSARKKIRKMITSHIGTDPSLVQQFNSGEIEVEFNPMGTWIERIRCGGGGLGGVLTRTGLGTGAEKASIGKVDVEGTEHLLYAPLRADVALIKAHRGDKDGNLQYRGTSLNSNPVMATAADLVIAEVDEIVAPGEIPFDQVGTPGILVDVMVESHTFEERKQVFTDLWVETRRLAS